MTIWHWLGIAIWIPIAIYVIREWQRDTKHCLICNHLGAEHSYGVCWNEECWMDRGAVHRFVPRKK